MPISTDWQKTTNSNIAFNALPPGDYKIEIKAKNIYGIESETRSLSFEVIPAFWMTLWFKMLALFVAVLLGYWGSLKTIRMYKSQAKFQRMLNEMQVVSLQSKMSPHFIFNSLNSIQNYILKNERDEANDYLLGFSKLIRIILQNSDSTTITLSKEMEILKMYVELEQKRLRTEFTYVVEIDSSIDQDCEIPSLLIQPYIENSIWHGKVYSNPNGQIKIKVSKTDNTLYFEISDNGIGIKKAKESKVGQTKTKHKSIGSVITKKRIQLLSEIHNQMSVVEIFEAFPNLTSNNYVGTIVKFNIPYII